MTLTDVIAENVDHALSKALGTLRTFRIMAVRGDADRMKEQFKRDVGGLYLCLHALIGEELGINNTAAVAKERDEAIALLREFEKADAVTAHISGPDQGQEAAFNNRQKVNRRVLQFLADHPAPADAPVELSFDMIRERIEEIDQEIVGSEECESKKAQLFRDILLHWEGKPEDRSELIRLVKLADNAGRDGLL